MSQACPRLALLTALTSSGLAVAQPQLPPSPDETAAAVVLPAEERESKDLAVYAGHVESNNLARTPAEEDGSFDTLGLFVGLGYASTRFETSIDADLEHRRYSLDTLKDETVGNLKAAAEIDLVRERFSWLFSDAYGQGITDPFSGLGPGNRESINVLGTGPKLALPLGDRMNLEASGQLSKRRFDEAQDFDSDSTLYELGLYRQISSTARFGLVASSNDIEFVDVVAPEYEISRLGFRYEKTLATGAVLADAGTNEIDALGAGTDEPFYTFVWTRALGARSELSIGLAREITDSGGVLGTSDPFGVEGSSFTDIVVSPNPLEQRRLSVSYVLTLGRTVVSANIGSFKDEYIGNAAIDNDSTTSRLAFVRNLSEQLSVGISYGKIDREFTAAAAALADSEDSWTGAWVNRTLGRRFGVGFLISTYDRNGFDSYDERRYEFRFGYTPADSRVAIPSVVGR